MAASDPVPDNREILRNGDVAYKRVVSEAVLTRFAGINNFMSKFQNDYVSFFLNGVYRANTTNFGIDGAYTFFTKSEIVGVQIWNAVSGLSGTTELDIQWISSNGSPQGTIFGTTPKINSTSSNATRGFRNLVTGNDFTMTGVTLPVLNKTVFNEGDSIYLQILNAMTRGKNAALTLNIRPIV